MCQQVSHLAATPEEVWSLVGTFDGVNEELWPWLQMTCPEPQTHLETWAEGTQGQTLFESQLLLFGALPIDRHALGIEAIYPGEGFDERSHSRLHAEWRHRRRVEPVIGGCRVSDCVDFQPRGRLAPMKPAIRVVVRAVFAWRHRRLRLRFGG